MTTALITNPLWLEPLLPTAWPVELLAKADNLLFEAGKLTGMLSPATAHCLGQLLRLTSSFYSHLIEGQYTEPLVLANTQQKRTQKELTELAIYHIQAQAVFERFARRYAGQISWKDCFSTEFSEKVHARLFIDASDEQRRLRDGSIMAAGQLRDLPQKNVEVGNHIPPDFSAVRPMLIRMQQVYGQLSDRRLCLLSALAYHHRWAWVHPFPDGNGRVIRLITHLQLSRLGLTSPLWSLSRGLARRQEDYYARLANADAPRHGDLDGRGQLSQKGLIEFVDFMLDTCLDQIQYIQNALDLSLMRARLERIVVYEAKFINTGIQPEAVVRALHILISQGQVTRSDFKVYLGLGERAATSALSQLINVGVVRSPTPKSRMLYLALPVWFAQLLFPDLHKRFI